MSRLSHNELAAIGRFLEQAGVPIVGPLEATTISGGRSNLTFRVQDQESRWVLRMPPRTGRTPSAHDVAREFRITDALRDSGVPVPPAVALCEDESVVGFPFAVAEFVEGRTVQSRADLDRLEDPVVAAVVDRLVRTLATLHAVDYRAVGLGSYGRPHGYAARQLRRWSAQWELVGDPALQATSARLVRRLEQRLPEQGATGIVHGDFRIDNTLLLLHGDPAIAAVVDWELSTIGDPVADVAMMCAYRDPAFDLIVGTPGAWTSDRLPAVVELAARYEAAAGTSLDEWEFHLSLAYFKIGVIAAGIAHRVRLGASSGSGFDTAGESVARYLELAHATLATP